MEMKRDESSSTPLENANMDIKYVTVAERNSVSVVDTIARL